MLKGIKNFFLHTDEEMAEMTYNDGFKHGVLFFVSILVITAIIFKIVN